MHKITRLSVAALALTALLGTVSCGVSTPSTPTDETSATAESVPSIKPEGFDEKIVVNDILPANWEGSSGWRAVTEKTEDNVFPVGDYLAYLEGKQLQSDGDVENEGRLIFVDRDGNKTYPAKDSTSTNSKLKTVNRDGKSYLVYSQSFVKEADANSLSKSSVDETFSLVTTFDETGKELYSKEIKGSLAFDVADTIEVSDTSILDPATGEVAPAPTMDGHQWVGNYDGVDLFMSRNYDSPVLTDGDWTIPTPGSDYQHPPLYPFGKALAVKSDTCIVIDPHSGQVIDAALNAGFLCSWSTGAPAASPDGVLVAFDQGVYSLKDKKLTKFSEDIHFNPVTITNDGDVYGEGSEDKVGFVNLTKGGDPVALPGANVVPLVVSGSGLAAFEDYKNEKSTLFMVKR